MHNDAADLYGESANDTKLARIVIGSTAFKWVMGAIGAGAISIFCLGFKAYTIDLASQNTDVIATKADISVLKADFRSTNEATQLHTAQIAQATAERARTDAVQGRIFKALEQLSTDLHSLDLHITKVDQKVDDLKDSQPRR